VVAPNFWTPQRESRPSQSHMALALHGRGSVLLATSYQEGGKLITT
jgi:hypothetical protein